MIWTYRGGRKCDPPDRVDHGMVDMWYMLYHMKYRKSQELDVGISFGSIDYIPFDKYL